MWNGEFYANFGPSRDRQWTEAQRCGFFCAGGDRRRTRQLDRLEVGSRIWVYIPKKGYINVGIVRGKPTIIDEFTVTVDGVSIPIVETDMRAAHLRSRAIAEHTGVPIDTCEYFVAVCWLKHHQLKDAVYRSSFYKDRSLVSRPGLRNEESGRIWDRTVKVLKNRWRIA